MLGRLMLVFLCLVISPSLADENDEILGGPGERVALVVGNGDYSDSASALDNPANDAKAMAAKFRGLGIEVIEAIDLDYRGMRETLRVFDRALQDADAGIFYYAGHAMEYRGQNYLVPTDAVLETEGDVGLGLIDMDQILQVMETTVPTRLIFLDACRNNPMARSFRNALAPSRSTAVGRGLGQMQTAVGTFIAYATAPGDVAADGDGENSPFTAAMLTHLDEPGLDISRLMQRVRNTVIAETKQSQIPWDSSSLRGPFVLHLDVTISPNAGTASVVENTGKHTDALFWESVKDSQQIADLEAYIERFGDDGIFAPLAKTRIHALSVEHAARAERKAAIDRHGLQEALNDLGYDPGTADGIFGERTRAAIMAWQRDRDERATGYVSMNQAQQILAEVKPSSNLAASASNADENYVRALTIYEKECADGDAKSCYEVGDIYQHGKGVDSSPIKAGEFYQKACDSGIAAGCTDLGFLHSRGLGFEKNYEKAYDFYSQGCRGGHARGCGNVGFLYRNGYGIKQDLSKAAAYYGKACDGGFAKTCYYLGNMYQGGKGVEQDNTKAARSHQQACDLGHAGGCTDIGYLYENGFGVEKDYTKSFRFYRKGCDGGNAVGCFNLGDSHEYGRGVAKDNAKALSLYEKACRSDYAPSCARLADLQKKLQSN